MTEQKNFNDQAELKNQTELRDLTDLKESANLLTDEEMNNVAGGLVNAGESGSIPSSGGLRLEPVNTRNNAEEQNKPKTPSGPFPQNCG